MVDSKNKKLAPIEGEHPSITEERLRQVRLQWQEPMGEYHVPEKPRFKMGTRINPLNNKEYPSHPVSLDPAIEIIDRFSTGWSGISYKHVLFRFEGKIYAFRYEYSEEITRDGVWTRKSMPYGPGTGRKVLINRIIFNVRFMDRHIPPGTDEQKNEFRHVPIEKHHFTSLDDPIAKIVFEYLAVDFDGSTWVDVTRIVILNLSSEPIAIKNWKVVRHG
ncbi:MAG: hypothetical protein WBC85_16625 [Planktotalea sp.]|uniref:hypothetical protein n=1 Tax=Planktotalea sp. TaxID=2029877 RepID=UPI003C779419